MSSRRILIPLVISAGLVLVSFTDGWRAIASPPPKSAHQLTPAVVVSKVSATPGAIKPTDVLTIGVQLDNSTRKVDAAVVEVEIVGDSGESVLAMRQRNVVLSAGSTQEVYWVWRVPAKLDDGTYALGVTVRSEDNGQTLARAEKVEAFRIERAA